MYEWSRWKSRFEQFRYASGLSDKDDARQISTLLYCLGEEAEDVLKSTKNQRRREKGVHNRSQQVRIILSSSQECNLRTSLLQTEEFKKERKASSSTLQLSIAWQTPVTTGILLKTSSETA